MLPNDAGSARPSSLDKLPAERVAWQALLKVLEQEEEALVEGEADLLPKLSAAKMAQLQTLNTLARARHDGLLSAGLSADPAGMDAWLERDGTAEQQVLWESLQKMEQQAQAMNQRIGVLIELRLNSTRQALNVLVQAAKSQGGLYDQGGCSVASRNGKPLTAA
ncbi:MAG: flagellar protein FlgN [Thiobacillus sp.]|nr:flagellar protein FlgN [Thiobacillus sp.]